MCQKSNRRLIAPACLFILIALLASCSSPNPKAARPTRTVEKLQTTPLVQSPAAATSSPEPLVPMQAAPIHPLDTDAALTDSSAWLIYATMDEGLMAINADGGGPNPLYDLIFDVYGLFDLPNGLLDGRDPLVAMRIERSGEPGLELIAVSLPDLAITNIAPMISEEVINSPASQEGFNIDINFAVMEESAVRWSPDGKYLAYVAASSNNTADIFVYDRMNGTITQVTDCGLLAATPYWTPDSQRILYHTVYLFGDGYTWSIDSFWIINRNGTGSRQLNPTGSEGAKIDPIGFLNNSKLLVTVEGSPEPGLYVVDINESIFTAKSAGFVESVDYDPASGAFAFIDESGQLKLSPAPIAYADAVDETNWSGHQLHWYSQLNGFLVFGSRGVYRLDLAGFLTQLSSNDAYPYPSPDGSMLCLAGAGLICLDASGIEHAVSKAVYTPLLWADSGEGFFYLDQTNLYYTHVEDFVPKLADDDLYPVDQIWGTLDLKNIGWLASID